MPRIEAIYDVLKQEYKERVWTPEEEAQRDADIIANVAIEAAQATKRQTRLTLIAALAKNGIVAVLVNLQADIDALPGANQAAVVAIVGRALVRQKQIIQVLSALVDGELGDK